MDIVLFLIVLLVGLVMSVYVLYRWWGRVWHKGKEARREREQLLRDWQDSWDYPRPYLSPERVDLAGLVQREE